MLGCKAGLLSYTHAKKAQNLLTGYGYKCEIRRNTQTTPEGCSYQIIVNADCTSVSDILVYGEIPYKTLKMCVILHECKF